MLNCPELRTLYRICHDLTSRCVAVDHNAVDTYYQYTIMNSFWSEMPSVELKTHQIHFRPGSFTTYTPPDPQVGLGW